MDREGIRRPLVDEDASGRWRRRTMTGVGHPKTGLRGGLRGGGRIAAKTASHRHDPGWDKALGIAPDFYDDAQQSGGTANRGGRGPWLWGGGRVCKGASGTDRWWWVGKPKFAYEKMSKAKIVGFFMFFISTGIEFGSDPLFEVFSVGIRYVCTCTKQVDS